MRTRLFLLLVSGLLFAGPVLCAAQDDYRVGSGDVIRVSVYDNPDLTTVARIDSGGAILFPLIGQVKIAGMSVSQISEHLARELADGYIVNPQVSVFIEDFRSKKVTIIGQVRTPGLYELSGPITLLELISQAGGLAPDAGEQATIKRKATPSAEEQILTVDLRELLEKGPRDRDVALYDGDSVFINKSGVFYVSGQVRRPDAYRLEEGTTVIKAVTMAGGFTDIAAENKIRVIRRIGGAEQVMNNVPLHAPVLPEDVIVVPESFF